MNFLNLLETVKNQIDYSTFQTLQEDFMEQFRDEYAKIRPCKSVSEKAIAKYIKAASLKDDKTATYTKEGTTALLLGNGRPLNEGASVKKSELAPHLLEMLKTKRPSDCYFFDSLAMYKALKKQESRNYFLKIDGHIYNAALVAEMVECIATSKEKYISAEICENGALLIRQNHAAVIMPISFHDCPTCANVNAQNILKHFRAIETSYLDEIKRTA